MLEVKSWMDAVCLKLNESKTECIYYGSQQLLQKCNTETIIVICEIIIRCNQVRHLGVILNSSLEFKAHIINKCETAMVNLIWIKNIRKYIDNNTCHTLA